MPSVADNGEPAVALHDALGALQKASRLTAKQRAVKVSGVVDVICQHAFERGLDPDALSAVVQIAAKKTELDQTSVTTLVKNLYPAQRVPAHVAVTLVGALGQGKGKPSPGTQNELVKWLVLVHGILDDPNVLSRLYGVLFGMLDTISIRTSLCHLLSLVTRRRHVKPFRIQQLLELSRGLGNEPALQGLLRVYRDYYPDIILGSANTTRKSFPPQPDPEWRARLNAIQEASIRDDQASLGQYNGFRVLRHGAKRSKLSAIPEVHTFQAHETSVTLEEIDSVDDFVEKLDRIEPPAQMISFLSDPLLQKFTELRPSRIATARIDLWLSACLEDEYLAVQAGRTTSSSLSDTLDGLYKHAQYTKALLPIVYSFMQVYLPVWDAVTDVDALLGLLSYLPLQPFQDAYTAYIGHAEKAVLTLGPAQCPKLLHFYEELLRHWVTSASPQPPTINQLATSSSDQSHINSLAIHVSTLSTSLLLSLPSSSNLPLTSAVLSFYECLSSSSQPHLIPIIIPQQFLVYHLAQSPSVTSLSRICGILGAYKTAFDKHPKPNSRYYPTEVTTTFNCCLKDLYNLLWIAHSLIMEPEKNVAGFLCKPPLRVALHKYLGSLDQKYSVASAFNFSCNPSLASLSASAWRAMEESEIVEKQYDRQAVNYHKGPVSQTSLQVLANRGGVDVGYEEYKVQVLEWTAARGLEGVSAFMHTTVKTLREDV
ncbi:Mis6-domain-containing protein [Polyplosphaeria fusca]|uniref:Mis6-domain-containing protein n=1 Tax=Polyplosphaeria fusca TaxID=682080 RepID=A0A9P4R4T7_9PLEO|nr:Mis6-domain-containing protein [Polyplosphaeria fusca]